MNMIKLKIVVTLRRAFEGYINLENIYNPKLQTVKKRNSPSIAYNIFNNPNAYTYIFTIYTYNIGLKYNK